MPEKSSKSGNNNKKKRPDWYYATAKYAAPNYTKACIQMADTLALYALFWAGMIFTVLKQMPYWTTVLFALPAAALMVRIFVLFHDCVHNSFMPSRKANRLCGCIFGILVCTPYEEWQWTHARHHATAADLDRRGYGSIWTMTVGEYLSADWMMRTWYRLFRNPFVLFGIAPTIKFILLNRFPSKGVTKRQKRSVLITNIALAIILSLAVYLLGVMNVVKTALPVVIIATSIGMWLFYVQHQFEGVYWARHEEWDIMTAVLKGCSYYKLPNLMHWLTCNIGIHHIHHLRTAIPNYRLQECYDNTPELQDINAITIRQSMRSLRLNLWDEKKQKLVSFRQIRQTKKEHFFNNTKFPSL